MTWALYGAVYPERICDAQVVSISIVDILSFIATGILDNGPSPYVTSVLWRKNALYLSSSEKDRVPTYITRGALKYPSVPCSILESA